MYDPYSLDDDEVSFSLVSPPSPAPSFSAMSPLRRTTLSPAPRKDLHDIELKNLALDTEDAKKDTTLARPVVYFPMTPKSKAASEAKEDVENAEWKKNPAAVTDAIYSYNHPPLGETVNKHFAFITMVACTTLIILIVGLSITPLSSVAILAYGASYVYNLLCTLLLLSQIRSLEKCNILSHQEQKALQLVYKANIFLMSLGTPLLLTLPLAVKITALVSALGMIGAVGVLFSIPLAVVILGIIGMRITKWYENKATLSVIRAKESSSQQIEMGIFSKTQSIGIAPDRFPKEGISFQTQKSEIAADGRHECQSPRPARHSPKIAIDGRLKESPQSESHLPSSTLYVRCSL